MYIGQHKKKDHKDQIQQCDVVKKNHNKAKKTFIKTWLAEWKVNVKDATQTWERKNLQPKAWIKLLDSMNKVASVKLNTAEGTDTELSNAKDD